jgi:pyruvate kinase
MQLVSKVETRQALYSFKSILEESSAIIISRGVLGLDVAPEKVWADLWLLPVPN